MKAIIKLLENIALIAVIGLSLASCGDGGDSGGNGGNVAVTGVSLNKTILSLNAGETETLTAAITPSNATNKKVAWNTSNPAVTTVLPNGMVSGISSGTATISATTDDGGKTATCTVTVTGGGSPHTHTYSATWSSNATQHWRECTAGDGATTDLANHAGNPCTVCGYSVIQTFTSIAAFKTWLDSQSTNTATNPYYVKINISSLGGSYDISGSLGSVLYSSSNRDKYVNLDLSGSTFTSIVLQAFAGCIFLTGVTIPDSVTSIADETFINCANLASIIIPSSVKSIGKGAFAFCSSLASITIPNSVTSIVEGAFVGCKKLVTINVDSGNNSYSSENGVLYNKNKSTLIAYPTASGSYTIPNSVNSIGGYAFYSCTSLTSITIPNSVTSIGEWAFYHCTSLTSITIPNSVTSIGGYVFDSCTSLTSITIPNSVTSIGKGAFAFCSSLASLTIPNSVKSIGILAFSGCNSLTSVTFQGTIPSSRFDVDAFYREGDLRAKFYATNSSNGTPGTYTRASGSDTWTKQ